MIIQIKSCDDQRSWLGIDGVRSVCVCVCVTSSKFSLEERLPVARARGWALILRVCCGHLVVLVLGKDLGLNKCRPLIEGNVYFESQGVGIGSTLTDTLDDAGCGIGGSGTLRGTGEWEGTDTRAGAGAVAGAEAGPGGASTSYVWWFCGVAAVTYYTTTGLWKTSWLSLNISSKSTPSATHLGGLKIKYLAFAYNIWIGFNELQKSNFSTKFFVNTASSAKAFF